MVELLLLMKGGKDMKKTYKFECDENSYIINYKNAEVFRINKDNLKVDGTKFYETFFKEYSVEDIIEVKKGKSIKSSDKLANPIYDTIDELIKDIIDKIKKE